MKNSNAKTAKHCNISVNGITVEIYVNDIRRVLRPSPYAELMMEAIVFTEAEKNGDVLDLGTGSGVLGLYALKSGCRHVKLTDIAPSALHCAGDNLYRNKISSCFEIIGNSDLFEHLGDSTFDLIMCNGPQLPDIPELRIGSELDGALLSGNDGMKFILRFLKQFDKHLNPDGRAVITHPSFWSEHRTSTVITKMGYVHTTLAKELLPFDIYPFYDSKQYEALIKSFSKLSKKNGSRYISVPGREFSLAIWEIKKRATS